LRPPWRAPQSSNPETLVAQFPKRELPLPPPASELDRASRGAAPPPEEKKKERKAFTALSTNGSSSLSTQPPAASLDSLAKERAKVESGATAAAVSQRAGDLTQSQTDKKFREIQGSGEIQTSALPATNPAPAPPNAAPAAPQLQANVAPNAPAVPASRPSGDSNAIRAMASRENQMAQNEAVPKSAAGPARPEAAETLKEGKVWAFALARPLPKDAALLQAPSGATFWRAGSGGRIERSTDGGKTWAPQVSPSPEDWLAGVAVSDSACWLVGRRGAIARTIDGQRWQLVAPPPQATTANGALPDWTTITAVDSQTATISAVDGRRFSTGDGGKTWRQQ
jgi:hypothetical protein